jgi:hypothetical protein
LATLAVAGIVLAVVSDRLLPDLIARHPVTANLAASILGAPLLLLLAVVLLDRLAAAERRRGWVNRNYEDLRVSVPRAVAALEQAVAAQWPPSASYETVYADTVTLIEGLEEVPNRHLEDKDPVVLPADLLGRAALLRERLPPVNDEALVDALARLAAALEPLAMQHDAPRLSETALDARIACQQAAGTLESEAYRTSRFLGLLDDLAATSPVAPVWSTAEKAFVTATGTATRRFNPQYLAHSGFGYLEQFSSMRNVEALCDAVTKEITRTL